MADGEKVVADRRYKGHLCVCNHDKGTMKQRKEMEKAWARHKTVNGRLKNWSIVKQVFRHPREKHNLAFCAVAVIEQIKIENGQPPFQVDEVVDPTLCWE